MATPLPPMFRSSNRVPFTPAAADAFPGDALERRIEVMRERLAAGVPLCGSPGDPEPKPITRPACWACGLEATKATHVAVNGWVSRPFRGMPDQGLGMNSGESEIYCPDCFNLWGWPDE